MNKSINVLSIMLILMSLQSNCFWKGVSVSPEEQEEELLIKPETRARAVKKIKKIHRRTRKELPTMEIPETPTTPEEAPAPAIFEQPPTPPVSPEGVKPPLPTRRPPEPPAAPPVPPRPHLRAAPLPPAPEVTPPHKRMGTLERALGKRRSIMMGEEGSEIGEENIPPKRPYDPYKY